VVFSDPNLQKNSKETCASVVLVNFDETMKGVISGGACVAKSDNSSKVTTSGDTCVVNPDESMLETKPEETCVGNSDESQVLMSCLFNNKLHDNCSTDDCITTIRGDVLSPKIVVTVKKRSSIYNPHVIIWDTAATVHIFRNLDLFSDTPIPVNDDDISFVGFDTSSGHTFVVSKGTLKHPFQ
jgi:hypothetical protein